MKSQEKVTAFRNGEIKRNRGKGNMGMDACTLCPRMCGVNRAAGEKGYCGMDATIRAARAALHMWEEPCISGTRGSGAVFFSGCSLRCIFCQNFEIAEGNCAKEISGERLSEIFLELQEQGAANINLVTAAHYVPAVIESLKKAKAQGMDLPVIYNSSGYERVETVQMLEEVVDVWLPDFKYMDSKLAFAYSRAKDYPEVARAAIREMMKAAGTCAYDEDGYIQKGVIVRHLILPGHTKNSIAVLDELYGTYGDDLTISLMNQYTPLPQVRNIPDLNRRVTKREYEKVLDHALDLGITQGFFQEGGTAKESFIPLFDYEGL